MKEVLVIGSTLVAVVVGILVVTLVPMNYYLNKSCVQTSESLGFGHEYGFVKGCIYVLPDGSKVSSDNYIVVGK